ncbi:MAG: hypothetical protein FWE50_03075 [Alphaproteobacteria bacterium]|nr:hypothetical protein [Alphaproteobacteria bacterium]
MIEKFFPFLMTAGKYAADMQKNIDFLGSYSKSEQIADIVTRIDLDISQKFIKFCADNFEGEDYIIVDEERLQDLGADPKAEIKNHKYAFIIDPIDGTLPYRNKLPMWAISIGVWSYGQPLYGVVYAPSMQIMQYCDDDNAYLIEGVFTSQEWKQTIKPLPDSEESSKLFIMTSNSILMARHWREHKIPRQSFNSAVISGMMVLTGKAIGFIGRDYLWDFAALLPIANKVGVKIYNFKTKQVFDFSMLNNKLGLADYELICRPKYLEFIKENTEYSDVK